ncbi:hypothetical protein [Pseudomonas orientalis]|uniref:Uncharacterized protein n=1 Tax=Pseudomonas orientalis TaxID=76758 RepID=A0A2L0S0I5_9PSED|nr:hypothetical protein [Pseudomonas orientalis]AUZ47788.1 hypothetical protein BOP93_20085 [Pseudomonas orientalis]
MHTSKKGQKTIFAKGVVGCNVSFAATPFTSDSVNFYDASATDYSIVAYDGKANPRMVYIRMNKKITPGTYDFKINPENPEVFAYYYHAHENFGWYYHAEEGKFVLKSVDFEKLEIDATFAFTSTNTPDEQPMAVQNGVLTITGPSA